MITNYRMIGKLKMQHDRFAEMPPSEQNTYIVRQNCTEDSSFEYTVKGDTSPHYGRIVQMNLDTSNQQISFIAVSEIDMGVCADRLIFKNFAPGDSNIYAAHSSYKSILGFSLMEYIEGNRRKIRWSEPAMVDKCLKYLKQIRDVFFVDDSYGLRPNYRLLSTEQAIGFPDPEIEASLRAISDDKAYKKARDKAQKKYFTEHLAEITGQRQAYAITIDGKYLHEIEEIADCYLDVLFYHIADKQFADSKNDGFCHLCAESTKLSEKVSLKHKFYGVNNPYYFDGASASMSKNAFSMCKDCYNEITVGIRYASSNFKTFLLGLNCFILPDIGIVQNADIELIDPASLQSIPKLLKRRGKTEYQNSLNTVKQLQTRLSGFSLFFYYEPSPTSQEFIVSQLIKGISLPSVVQKNEDLDELSLTHNLPELFNQNYGLSLEGLRFMLLPSKESHTNLKPIDYQKINRDILGLLSTYLYSQAFDFELLIKSFVNIHSRKRIHVGELSLFTLDLSPYIMSLYLKHLINFHQLRGLKSREEQTMTTTLEKASLLDYFSNNSEVYKNNYLAQGLFILGVYISEIERKQRDKGIKRTAITKLNLRGIPIQKVKSVMAVIDDLRGVWDVYNDPITDAYYRECMNKLVSSSFSPEETVFHILSGRAYNSYVGLMEYRKHQAIKDSQEAQND